MPTVLKRNITGATPSRIIELLMIYKEGVEIPLDSLPQVLKALQKGQHHLFALAVKGDKAYLEYDSSVKKI